MGIEFGRISGPLLAANLERDGVDLAFETNLLYLDVTNGRIGINSDGPATELFVNSKFRTTNLNVVTSLTTPNYSITTNRIQNLVGTVYLQPDQTTDPIISGPGFGTRNYATSTNYLNIKDRLIENVTADSDINLRPPGTGKVVFNTDQLYVNGALTATGKITLDGDITFGNNSDDNVIFDTDVNSGLTPNINITYDLGKDLKRWLNIYVDRLIPITSVSTDNLSVVNTLTVNGPGKLDSTVLLGNASTDVITFNGLVDSNILPSSGSYAFGNSTTPLQWNTLFLSDELTVSNVSISNNQITTATGDLVFKAAGAGEIHLANSDVEITNDLTASTLTSLKNTVNIGFLNLATVTATGNINQTTAPGYTGTSDLHITGKFANNNITVTTPSYLSVPNIKFVNNNIQVTVPDTDLKLQAAGGVVFNRQIKIASNVISNIFDANNINLSYNNLLSTENLELILLESIADYYLADVNNDRDYSIIFKPNGVGNTVIYSTQSLVLPIGNNSNRVLSSSGEIRQNSTTGLYEGYSITGRVSFNNIYDSDSNTYITPELTPGYNDNKIRFAINGEVKANIDSTRLYSDSLRADNVNVLGNTISNNISSNDLTISPDGAGSVIINDLPLKGNIIPNNNNSAFILASTDDGYVKFGGTGAVVFPSGDTASRLSTPELGAYRYNSETGLQEIYEGTRWVPANGSINNVSREDLENELNFWGFILG